MAFAAQDNNKHEHLFLKKQKNNKHEQTGYNDITRELICVYHLLTLNMNINIWT